jgi:hypothetical protein
VAARRRQRRPPPGQSPPAPDRSARVRDIPTAAAGWDAPVAASPRSTGPWPSAPQVEDDRPIIRRRRRDNADLRYFLIALAVIVPLAVTTLAVGVFLMARAGSTGDAGVRSSEDEEKGEGRPPEPRPAPPPGVPGKTTVDLVPLVNPKKDALEDRKWAVAGNALRCDDGSFVPKLQLPYRPPQEYDFVVTFSQPELRNGVALIMPHPGGGSFFWLVGAGDGAAYGFDGDDKQWGRSPGLVKANTACTTVVQVRRDGVRALVNGRELGRADYRDLRCDGWRTIKDQTLLGLACDDPTVFHYVRVVEVTGDGKKTR